MRTYPRLSIAGLAMALLALAASPASATWSMVIVDPVTDEVAIGSATCLTGFDLQKGTPVLLVGIGGAAAQSMIDGGELNRSRIWDWFLEGIPPDSMITLLSGLDFFHQQRQYGIVNTGGEATTFTGNGAGRWAGGVVGEAGGLVYAVQGNIMVDSTVVYEAEQAIRNTPGDIAEKMMAAMEAARDRGGDSRCTPYGKSAHVGYMLLARPGDTDGTCGQGDGCANGDYLMVLNIPDQQVDDPDPVDQLRTAFDAWRLGLVGRPDGVRSTVAFDVDTLPPNGAATATMTIDLLDWQGLPIAVGIDSVTIDYHEKAQGVTKVRNVTDLGGGRFTAEVVGLELEGTDAYVITAYDGDRPVRLTPPPVMTVAVPPGGFEIHPPVPGIAGVENTICVTGGTPDATVRIVFGRERGVLDTPCGPLGIRDGAALGEVVVGGDGTACLTAMVPAAAQGLAVRFQAVEVPGCGRSNGVVATFD